MGHCMNAADITVSSGIRLRPRHRMKEPKGGPVMYPYAVQACLSEPMWRMACRQIPKQIQNVSDQPVSSASHSSD